MHKIAFITDIHANLPALEATLSKLDGLEVDEIIIGGDSIGIGPYPAETLARIMGLQNCVFINGNHELVAIYGISKFEELIESEEKGYVEHAKWCNSQLTPVMLNYLKVQPLSLKKVVEGVKCNFIHYPIDQERKNSVFPFKHEKITDDNIELIFSEYSEDLVGFGHEHQLMIKKLEKTLLNPGSLGCFDKPIARFVVIDFHQGKFKINQHSAVYDDTELYKEFEERNVPDRKFIYKTFFGGRFEIK